MVNSSQGSNKWYVLILSTLIIGLGLGMPTMCMPVLFKEIAGELGLNLVEIGFAWGTISLAGLVACFISGVLGDRFGLKRTITVACFLGALTGAARGLSADLFSLMLTSFLFSFLNSAMMINIPKSTKVWFPQRHFGIANGIQATGMSLGLTLGAMISATMLSPALGGWRHVLFLYGLVTVILGIIWLVTVREPGREQPTGSPATPSMLQSIRYVSRLRRIWFLGLAMAGYVGCIQGITGYLSIYLQNIGWSPASADGALAAFNIAGAFGAIPLTLLSDRIGQRKTILLLLIIMALAGTALLPFFSNEVVWVLAIVIGFTRDAAMTLFIIMTMEIKEIDVIYTGTALGLLQTLSRIGGAASPPLGNALASPDGSTPFFFWAVLAAAGLVILALIRYTEPESAGHRLQTDERQKLHTGI